jgi:hypothetical protein
MFLLARVPLEMDLYARARIIEAAGGLPKWSLSRTPRVFLVEGPSQFPEVDPTWFSNRDQGVAEAVLSGAKSVLSGEGGEATAEEIAQNMAAGLAVGGEEKLDIYGYLGVKYANEILTGRKSPVQVKNTLFGYAKDRALDVWRKRFRQERERERSHPTLVGPSVGTESPAETAIDRTPNEVMLSLISGPAGRQFRNWVYQTVSHKATPVQKLIVDVSLDHLARTGDWPPASAIRDRIIEQKGSDISIRKINDHRKTVEELIAREMKDDPKILDWAERYLDLAALGFGGGQLHMARSIKRVADRFLEVPPIRTAAEVDRAKKPGEWNLMLYKSRATRWDYFLQNPQGGGGGSTSYTSAGAALRVGLSRVDFRGADRVWVIQAIWDPETEDYKVTKTFWQPVPL